MIKQETVDLFRTVRYGAHDKYTPSNDEKMLANQRHRDTRSGAYIAVRSRVNERRM